MTPGPQTLGPRTQVLKTRKSGLKTLDLGPQDPSIMEPGNPEPRISGNWVPGRSIQDTTTQDPRRRTQEPRATRPGIQNPRPWIQDSRTKDLTPRAPGPRIPGLRTPGSGTFDSTHDPRSSIQDSRTPIQDLEPQDERSRYPEHKILGVGIQDPGPQGQGPRTQNPKAWYPGPRTENPKTHDPVLMYL